MDNLLQNQLVVSWAFPENQAKRKAIVIAPLVDGWNYFDSAYRDTVYTETYNLIQSLIKDGQADVNRIYTVGKSCGGMAVYEFAEKYADDVAGAIALCGAESLSETALADAGKMVNVPIWIAHAVSDDTVPVDSSIKMYNTLIEKGSEKAKLKLYLDQEMNEAGVDGTLIGYHTVEMAALSMDYDGEEFMSWLFNQTKAVDIPNAPTDPVEIQKPSNQPNATKLTNNNNKTTTVQTGDAVNIKTWTMMVCVAAIAVIITARYNRRKNQ